MTRSDFIRALREEHDADPETAEELADFVAAEGLFDLPFDLQFFDDATLKMLRSLGVA